MLKAVLGAALVAIVATPSLACEYGVTASIYPQQIAQSSVPVTPLPIADVSDETTPIPTAAY